MMASERRKPGRKPLPPELRKPPKAKKTDAKLSEAHRAKIVAHHGTRVTWTPEMIAAAEAALADGASLEWTSGHIGVSTPTLTKALRNGVVVRRAPSTQEPKP